MQSSNDSVFSFKVLGESLVETTQKAKCVERNCEYTSTETTESFVLQKEFYKLFDEYFQTFKRDLFCMNLTQKETNAVISLCKNLIRKTEILCDNLLVKEDPKKVIVQSFNYVHARLCDYDSSYKRKKMIEKDPVYVKPNEKIIGVKWKEIPDPTKAISDFKLVQTRFQFVPISESLSVLFSNSNFKEMYMKYNIEKNHECTPGTYRDFCCGSTFKEIEIFEAPLAMQIQIGIDDFDPSDALKSKAGNQKMCGIYFELRNVPPEFSSKLDTRKLVALANVRDIKNEVDSMDLIIRHIIKDLKLIEDRGITLADGTNFKGALVNICYDNLGGNTILGLVESFNATYYCRICECEKKECQLLLIEKSDKLRDYQTYLECVQELPAVDRLIDVKETKGVKKYCLFNDLKFFKMFDNLSVDIMHDLSEGVIPFFISMCFETLSKRQILSQPRIQVKLRDYNYGFLNKEYKPSYVRFDRHSLGQSAKQLHCIMLNFPFIFNDQQHVLQREWNGMKELLSIIRIVYSNCITENDLIQLNESVQKHLSFIVESNNNLTPKHHILTHYAGVIRKMGPLIKMWMMRYESKHKVFTDMAQRTQNFINLPKTLANSHQIKSAYTLNNFQSEIQESKTTYSVCRTKDYNEHREHMRSLQIESDKAYKFLKHNSYEYRPGLIIFEKEKPFEIIHIVKLNGNYMLYCRPYLILRFDPYLNSIEITIEKDGNGCKLVELLRLSIGKTFDKTMCGGKFFIICESLDAFGGYVRHQHIR